MKPLPEEYVDELPEDALNDPEQYLVSKFKTPHSGTDVLFRNKEHFECLMDRYFFKVATHALAKREDVPLSPPGQPSDHPPFPGMFPLEARHSTSCVRALMAGFGKNTRPDGHLWSGQAAMQAYGSDAAGFSADACLMVVADGVGSNTSWLASLTAVHHMVRFYEQDPGRSLVEYGTSMAQEILKTIKDLQMKEATTLTTVKYDPATRVVEIMHIGDCVVYVLDSEGNIKFATTAGQHQHNFPHSLDPDYSYTNESHYQFYRTTVVEGDLIMLFSDGVADNFWPKEIVKFPTPGSLALATWKFVNSTAVAPIPFVHGRYEREPKSDDVAIVYRIIGGK